MVGNLSQISILFPAQVPQSLSPATAVRFPQPLWIPVSLRASLPCITKKGCEFIAHKLTGTKGTIFTARYINRFHEMQEIIARQAQEHKMPWFIRHIPEKWGGCGLLFLSAATFYSLLNSSYQRFVGPRQKV